MKITKYNPELHSNRDVHGRINPPHGAYFGMPMAAYHGAAAISQSDLKAFADKPRAFLKSRTPQGIKRKLAKLSANAGDTEARRVGRYVHTAVAEPADWLRYKALPDGWPLNETHAKVKNWRERNPGKTPVRAAEYGLVETIRDHVMKSDEHVAPMLRRAIPELSIFWKDKVSGLDMKARLDFWGEEPREILDIKTTAAADPIEWARDAEKYGYDAQYAHYVRAVQALGGKPRKFTFVVVTKDDDPDVFFTRIGAATRALACRFLDDIAMALAETGFLVPPMPEGIIEIDFAKETETMLTGVDYERI